MARRKPGEPTESEFLSMVVQLARLHRWRLVHHLPAANRRGRWATFVLGDAGEPDLMMCRGARLVFAELKVGSNTTTEAQDGWLSALRDTGAEVYVWTPDQWQDIRATLEGG